MIMIKETMLELRIAITYLFKEYILQFSEHQETRRVNLYEDNTTHI